MSRYWLLFVLVVVGLLEFTSTYDGAGYYDPKLLVKVNKLGKVRGKKDLPSYVKRHYYSYLGIPYAEEPRDHLRFKDPKVYPGWESRMGFDGVLDATEHPPPCLQLNMAKLARGKIEAQGEENCLTLNVFTSQPNNRTAKLPVMVYIHGGSYWFSSAKDANPQILLNKDIVLVSIQYRLGVLGFMTTEDDVMPGNLGLKDQAMAIAWVKKNIKVFGGDPENVTLFGNSAGGGSVSFHLLSPKTKGMFHRAILQSGTALCPWALGAADQMSLAKQVAAEVDCPTEEGSMVMYNCFRTANATKIMMTLIQTLELGKNPTVFGPRVDGDFLPERPEVLLKTGRFNKVPIMIGLTRDEGAISTIDNGLDDEQGIANFFEGFNVSAPVTLYTKYKGDDGVDVAKRIFSHYFGDRQPTIEDHQKLTEMYSAGMFSVWSDVTALLLSHHISPEHSVYSYTLSHRGKQSITDITGRNPKSKTIAKNYVCHSDELLYLFGPNVFGFGSNQDKVDVEMQNLISSMWINFANHSNPTPDESLGFQWLPATVGEFRHLDIKPQPVMQGDVRQKDREFWLSLPTKQNQLLEDIDFLHKSIKEEETREEQQRDPSPTVTEENKNEVSSDDGNAKVEL